MTPKEEYYWYKSHKICVICHSEEAEPGRVRCFECGEKQRLRDLKRKRDPEERAKQRKKLIQRKKEQGICVRCSKKATHGVHCYEHYIYMRRKNREYRTGKHFDEIGLCRICGEPPAPGKKLCEKHYKEYAERLLLNCGK
jgi:hypothetical protein